MKIIEHGVVVFTQGDIKIENWKIEREPDDPKDATDNQLLLAYAIHFAQQKFKSAMSGATMDLIRRIVKDRDAKVVAQKQKSQDN